jgi:hypothetical protein
MTTRVLIVHVRVVRGDVHVTVVCITIAHTTPGQGNVQVAAVVGVVDSSVGSPQLFVPFPRHVHVPAWACDHSGGGERGTTRVVVVVVVVSVV